MNNTNNPSDKFIRIRNVCKEFNLSVNSIMDIFKSHGIAINDDPNFKLTLDQYNLIKKTIGEDVINMKTARDLYYSQLSESQLSKLKKENELNFSGRSDLSPIFNKIINLFKEQKWEDCLIKLEYLQEKGHRLHIIYNYMGRIYYRKCMMESALYYYDKSISLEREYSQAYNNRGVVHATLGNIKVAIQDYTKAIELGRKYHQFDSLETYYKNRGYVYKKIGVHDRANKDFKKATKLFNGDNREKDSLIIKSETPLNGRQYPDGYGGYVDNKYINEVLDGVPEAYWNLD